MKSYLVFLVVFLTRLICGLFLSGFSSSMPPGTFDTGGTGWIVVDGIFLGCFSFMVTKILSRFSKNSAQSLMMQVVIFSIISCVESFYAVNRSGTPIEFVSAQIGYSISRMFPYAPKDLPISASIKTAVPQNSRIVCRTKNDNSLEILSGRGTLRDYVWNGASRSVQLNENVQMGFLEYPLSQARNRFPGYDWKMHDGIARFRGRESCIEVKSIEEACDWIKNNTVSDMAQAISKDGLIVAWKQERLAGELLVHVYQIYINGKKPTSLQCIQTDRANVEITSRKL